MNKLKAYFISLGGDINLLQSRGLVEKLPVKKDELPSKFKVKSKKIVKHSKPLREIPLKVKYSSNNDVSHLSSKRRK